MQNSANNGFPGAGLILCSPAPDLQPKDPLIFSLPPEMTSFLPGTSSGHLFQSQHTLDRAAYTSPSTRLQGSRLASPDSLPEQLQQCALHPSPLPVACRRTTCSSLQQSRVRLRRAWQTKTNHGANWVFTSPSFGASQTFAQQQQQVLFF